MDLRSLNARVVKQKFPFPFPLIEDCIARLGGCRVFTLLDLKDGFHQIKVHPDTKFLVFATPDGLSTLGYLLAVMRLQRNLRKNCIRSSHI